MRSQLAYRRRIQEKGGPLQVLVRFVKWGLGVALVIALGVAVTFAALDEPRPQGETGPEADRLAREIMAAVRVDAWNREVGAVEWNFDGRHQHLWDRRRSLVRVAWGEVVTLLDLADRSRYHVTRAGARVTDDESRRTQQRAYARWINDAFWLNPFPKLFDAGVTRARVTLEGGSEALLVSWSEGGVTPGDAYLFHLDPQRRPRRWQMWVQIIPVGGLSFSWDDYVDLQGGAKVATRHEGPITLRLTDVKSATSALALTGGRDPFLPLFEARTAAPASQPSKAEPP